MMSQEMITERSHRARRILVLVTELSYEKQTPPPAASPQTTQRSSLKRLRFPSGRRTRTLLIVQKPTRSQKDLFDESKTQQRQRWFKAVGLCDGMLLLLAERARQVGHGKTAYTFDGPLIPFRAKASYKHVSSKDESRLHQFGKKMLLQSLHGRCISCGGGWSGHLLTADCKDLENLYIRRCKHQDVAQEGKLLFLLGISLLDPVFSWVTGAKTFHSKPRLDHHQGLNLESETVPKLSKNQKLFLNWTL